MIIDTDFFQLVNYFFTRQSKFLPPSSPPASASSHSTSYSLLREIKASPGKSAMSFWTPQ